ncbi:acyl carrier protein [Roseococcus pinisoli]|uniref:Acyl carrier protein n=1 Tax=Roseococcus pinisoli TaxID=2835040 RepID=A0ABS5QDH0_9PROT|nr:acyl carrier protein [Roseococcus pinisoli]MBS7811729.1 acyl carrier protein [Roseococcus pinisoli]
MTEVETGIREVLQASARLSVPASSIGLDDDLFDRGLTSLSTVDLMLSLESKFNVEFPDEALKRQTFRSISSLRDVLVQIGAAA